MRISAEMQKMPIKKEPARQISREKELLQERDKQI